MKIIVAGVTEMGLTKLHDLLSGQFNEDGRICVTDLHEVTLRDQSVRTRVEISLPDDLAIKAGNIIEAVAGEAVATITC